MLTLLQLGLRFFRIGVLTFGGGYAMLPLMEAELVRGGWLTAAEFANLLAVAEATPGALAVNAATYVGYGQAGAVGALVASTALALPSLTAVLVVAGWVRRLRGRPSGAALFGVLRPAVAGLVVSAAWGLLQAGIRVAPADRGGASWLGSLDPAAVLLASAVFWAASRTRWHPALLVLGSGFLGVLLWHNGVRGWF